MASSASGWQLVALDPYATVTRPDPIPLFSTTFLLHIHLSSLDIKKPALQVTSFALCLLSVTKAQGDHRHFSRLPPRQRGYIFHANSVRYECGGPDPHKP